MLPLVARPLAPVSVGLTTAVTPGDLLRPARNDASIAVALVAFGERTVRAVEHDLRGGAGLGGEPLLQQVGRPLALGAGDREALAVALGVRGADRRRRSRRRTQAPIVRHG